jgi:mRNA-degrading endonuclease toxin of MazEF toxin-antitoxin module
MSLARGEIYLVSPPPGKDSKLARALVVVSRQTLCDSKADKVRLTNYLCSLSSKKLAALRDALRIALDVE